MTATTPSASPEQRHAVDIVAPPARLIEPDDVGVVRAELPILAALEDKPVYRPDRYERRVRILVVLLACSIFLPNLGAFGLWDPWETHYGAVTTEMIETQDWISPWWGSKNKVGDELAGSPFYSKPVFIFWSEAIMVRLIGRGEWAIRLPCAILAILAVFLTYLTLGMIYSRRTGLLAAGILATSPFFFMVSRQAQTDMPFVATMTLAMCFITLAFLGPRVPMSDRRFRFWTWATVAFVALNTIPQYLLLISDFSFPSPGAKNGFPSGSLLHSGVAHALVYFAILGIFAASVIASFRADKKTLGASAFKDRWIRKFQLFAFYVLVAHATYAKGLLGFGLPGAILLFWLILSWNWRVLRAAEIGRGVLLFIAVGFPWYMAMIIKHGKPYVDRFFWHDHFNRLSTGVHQIDSGTFEHFIKWLGIGFFPWVGFVPLALLWTLRMKVRNNGYRNQALLLFAVWAGFAFVLFTASSTKFHHYIFPAVPAMAVVTALFIRYLFRDGRWTLRFATLVAVVMVVAVGWDIKEDQQSLRSLMTYKYDRPLPEHLPIDADAKVAANSDKTWAESYFFKHTSDFLQTILTTKLFRYENFIPIILLLCCVMLGLFFVAKTRMAGLVGLGLTASMLAAWSLSYYMPSLSPHWSQKYLFDAYYDTCTLMPETDYIRDGFEPLVDKVGLTFISEHLRSEPKRVCEEDILSWLITWRGETYYSYNELKPIGKKEQFLPYMETMNGGRKFYVITEKGKESTIRSQAVSATKTLKAKKVAGFTDITDWVVKVENEESRFFQTVSATPVR